MGGGKPDASSSSNCRREVECIRYGRSREKRPNAMNTDRHVPGRGPVISECVAGAGKQRRDGGEGGSEEEETEDGWNGEGGVREWREAEKGWGRRRK